jgi:lipase
MTLFVHEFGPVDGAPLLALHGLSGHGGRFADLARRLPGRRLIAPDLRGMGRSPIDPPWHLDRHLADLVALLDRYELGAVPVLGHSLGGVLGLLLAGAAPERVTHLLLLDPGTGMPAARALAAADRMMIDVSYPDRAAARADRIAQGWAGLPAELVEAELDAHLVRQDDGSWGWRYYRPALIGLIGELAGPVPLPPAGTPTLLVASGRSGVVAPEWRRRCRERLAELLTVVEFDCGHLVYYERPGETAAAVAGALAATV